MDDLATHFAHDVFGWPTRTPLVFDAGPVYDFSYIMAAPVAIAGAIAVLIVAGLLLERRRLQRRLRELEAA